VDLTALAKTEGPEKKPKKMPRLFLHNLEASQRSLGRLIRARSFGVIESQMFKDLVYGLNTYLSYAKAQNEAEVLKRIEALEEKLEQSRV